ncbi:hypothetical protein ABIE83_002774 [Bradyrhizobium diazoefficiens]
MNSAKAGIPTRSRRTDQIAARIPIARMWAAGGHVAGRRNSRSCMTNASDPDHSTITSTWRNSRTKVAPKAIASRLDSGCSMRAPISQSSNASSPVMRVMLVSRMVWSSG